MLDSVFTGGSQKDTFNYFKNSENTKFKVKS